jgi:D-glycero-alpha-D-manno-heptose 1-phosphate guanylyltransferase
VSKENHDVIILAGGLGTRLRSVVHDTPKCLAPVAGKPFLHFLLQYLAKQNITNRIILSVGYLHNQIEDYIESVKGQYAFDFEFVLEEEPLGTGGGIQLALRAAQTTTALVLNGDTFYNADLQKFIDAHHNDEAHISLALKPLTNFDRYGTVEISDEGIITSFNEKKAVSEGLINGGIYAINVKSFLQLNMPDKFSFEQEYLSKTAQYNHKLCGSIDNGYFIDIGVPTDYETAQTSLKEIYG